LPKRGRPKKSATLHVSATEIGPLIGVVFAFASQVGGKHWLLQPQEMDILTTSLVNALNTIKNETLIKAVESSVGIAPWVTFASVAGMIIWPRVEETRHMMRSAKNGIPKSKTGFVSNGNERAADDAHSDPIGAANGIG
jgi:p-aminobenzoyl-glutamate transporter AbgT